VYTDTLAFIKSSEFSVFSIKNLAKKMARFFNINSIFFKKN